MYERSPSSAGPVELDSTRKTLRFQKYLWNETAFRGDKDLLEVYAALLRDPNLHDCTVVVEGDRSGDEPSDIAHRRALDAARYLATLGVRQAVEVVDVSRGERALRITVVRPAARP